MNWNFKKNLDVLRVEDFWYDLTDGGYIKSEELLDDPQQILELNKAIELISSFADQAFTYGIFEEY